MGKKNKMYMGCRDCKACSTSAVGNFGRRFGRKALKYSTFGMSEAAMAFTRNCGQCGHELSLHTGDRITNVYDGTPQEQVKHLFTHGKEEAQAIAELTKEWGTDAIKHPKQFKEAKDKMLAEMRAGYEQPEQEQSTPQSYQPTASTANSTADELLKLKQLLDAGALTQQEFDQQKQKLLGN